MPDAINSQLLASVIQRVERVEEEEAANKEDKKAIYEEAKEQGLDPKYIKYCIATKKKDREERMIEDANRALYLAAAGID